MKPWFVLGALVLAGCVTTPTQFISVASENRSAVTYLDGVPYLPSAKQHYVALGLIGSNYSAGFPPSFYVFVMNRTGAKFDFDATNVRALSGGRPVRVYSQEEAVAEIERGAARARMGVAMGAALQEAGDSLQANAARQSQVSGTATVRSPTGRSSNVVYSGTVTTYDPAAALAAQSAAAARIDAQSRGNMSTIESRRQSGLAIAAQILRRNTLSPNQSVFGRVILHAEDIAPNAMLEVRIAVGREEHLFYFITSTGRPN